MWGSYGARATAVERHGYDSATLTSMSHLRRTSARGPATGRRRLLATVLACLAAALGGCGGSESAFTPAEKAHAFALAGAACAQYDRFIEAQQAHEGSGSPNAELEQFLENTETRTRAVREAMRPLQKLPHVAGYIADLTAQEGSLTALSTQLRKSPEAYLKLAETEPFANNTRKYGADVASDAKLLGLSTCVGPRPGKPITG
jgi:hypothetical protein